MLLCYHCFTSQHLGTHCWVTGPNPHPLPRQPFPFLKPCSSITLFSTGTSVESEKREGLKSLIEHSVYRNTHFYNTSNHYLVNLSPQNEGTLQVKGYLLNFSRATSALYGSLNNFSTSRFCTDASNALSLCNPRYTLYADGLEDLLEMIAYGELTKTHPGHRPLTGYSVPCSGKARKKPHLRHKLSFLIPIMAPEIKLAKVITMYLFLQSKLCFNELWLNLPQFSIAASWVEKELKLVISSILFLLWFSTWCKKILVQVITDTYFSKQWAAVRTHWGSIRVPPQKCRPKLE